MFSLDLPGLSLSLIGDQVEILHDFMQGDLSVCCLGFSDALVIHILGYGYILISVDRDAWTRYDDEVFEEAAMKTIREYEEWQDSPSVVG